ncbi:MAG: 2-dehydro-3-deoxyglucarate aldolase [Limnohabitans sp.]|jgi:4-hydroxy-2-oxoheptanedioate aldolase|nr:2-dehydro-3-deoxyglucarate aldolase [Limnohabitans sp.]
MQTPINPFKKALHEKRAQIGLWMGLASPYTAEICAGAGFDWLLIDGEHAPNDLNSILGQLQAIAAYPNTHAIARVPVGHGHAGTTLLKQYLDLGVQTVLIPMVDTAEQAHAVVQACRYPPQGIRGMGGARASRWGRLTHYGKEANDQICVLVQAETQTALNNLDEIAAVEGVDGVFIGPADLSASLGHIGQPDHPVVRAAIEDAFARILQAGKAPGFLTPDETLSRHYLDRGGLFVGVGLDGNLLTRHTAALAARFKPGVTPSAGGGTY